MKNRSTADQKNIQSALRWAENKTTTKHYTNRNSRMKTNKSNKNRREWTIVEDNHTIMNQ